MQGLRSDRYPAVAIVLGTCFILIQVNARCAIAILVAACAKEA